MLKTSQNAFRPSRLSGSVLMLVMVMSCLIPTSTFAQVTTMAQTARGFQLNRYEPTPAGESSFLVNRPRYASVFSLAAGATFNYAHRPLFSRDQVTGAATELVSHLMITHVDLAVRFLNRAMIGLSLPVTTWVDPASPMGSTSVETLPIEDLRFSSQVRIHRWDHRDKSGKGSGLGKENALSLHVGAAVWVPWRLVSSSISFLAGDMAFRGQVRLTLDWRRSLTARTSPSASEPTLHISGVIGGLLREPSLTHLAPMALKGGRVGSEVQLGLSAYLEMQKLRLALGAEALFSSLVSGYEEFGASSLSMEILGGIHYRAKWCNQHALQFSAAAGGGPFGIPGVAAQRALFRIAYEVEAPPRQQVRDQDGDGVLDDQDQCPTQPKGSAPDSQRPGCPSNQQAQGPARDRDNDGVSDRKDKCPDEPAGTIPDMQRPGCPTRSPAQNSDSDNDGVPDYLDRCPVEPAGSNPDPQRSGCPAVDRDKDGIPDIVDGCPATPAGSQPDPQRPGCPLPQPDTDGDDVPDNQDQCPRMPAGFYPDPNKLGCPQRPDTDMDQVPDDLDKCPKQAGLILYEGCLGPGNVYIYKSAVVLPKALTCSQPKADGPFRLSISGEAVLKELAALMLAKDHQLHTVRITGYAYGHGDAKKNWEASRANVDCVYRWLVASGVQDARIQTKGSGQTQSSQFFHSDHIEVEIVLPLLPTVPQ